MMKFVWLNELRRLQKTSLWRLSALLFFPLLESQAAQNVMLTEVPDYPWYAGCFGTAAGNMMGFWDRHGLPNLYTGPTAGGVAPLNTVGANAGVRSMWANRAGFDGRPAGMFGHIDDYWLFYTDDFSYSYESAATDPHVTAGRPEHSPDCISDFIGASQNKFKNMNGECDGNVDAFAFSFWDSSGSKRTNYVPTVSGQPIRDIQSGLRAWSQFRGYDCEVVSQLADFNPAVPPGAGFTFADMKAEIDAGYPVMLFLQNPHEWFRIFPGMPQGNPSVHGMLAFGYYIDDSGNNLVRYKTSWGGSGDNTLRVWNEAPWEGGLAVRGVFTYRPFPKITQVVRKPGNTFVFRWDGPSSELLDLVNGEKKIVHRYVLEKASSLGSQFVSVSEPTVEREVTITNVSSQASFYRVRLLPPLKED